MFIVKNLGKKFCSDAGDKWALRNVSFSLPKTGLIAIKGDSGSGKSTLLNLLGSLERPSEGHIFFNGKDLQKHSKKELEDLRNFHFGFLYQHFNLLEGQTSLENVALPLLIRGEEKRMAKERAETLFAKFDMSLLENKQCRCLSGGEKQRVALLRALITDPSVIFADEPTGALDRDNETLVMKSLKELSLNHLVILVSHNERLIQTYGDRTITIQSGKAVADTNRESGDMPSDLPRCARKPKKSWKRLLLRDYFQRNLGKNLLSFVSGVIGFSSILLTGAFVNGSQKALEREKSKSLLYLQAGLSERITYPLKDSPLKLSKNERPSIETARLIFSDYPNISIENDYSYFVPTFTSFYLDGESFDPVGFNPIFDITLGELGNGYLVEGAAPRINDFTTCLINHEMAKKFSFSLIGKTITVSRATTLQDFDVSDDVVFSLNLLVLGVVKEFSFLNAPRVYYSYPAERSFFQSFNLPNISAALGRETTVDSLLNESLGDEPFSSYSYLCFAHSEKEALGLRTVQERLLTNESTCRLSNSSYDIEKGFSSLRTAVSVSLVPFLVVESVTVCFILGALAYSTFIEKRKEVAVLSALGARNRDLGSLFLSESVIVTMCSSWFSLCSLPLLEKIFNPFLLAKTGLSNVLSLPLLQFGGIPLLVPVCLSLFSFLLSVLGVGIPLAIVRRRPMAEGLRDE